MSQNVKLSVIMSVHNEENNLHKSLNSIVNQTYKKWELIIIDDNSSDNSLKIILEFCKKDQRIKYFRNSENKGIPYSLNRALKLSQGKFIARMDGDDFAIENRFKMQLKFLENNPKIDILGGGALIHNTCTGLTSKVLMPEYHNEIINQLFKTSPFIHPTIMAKKEFFIKNSFYNENYKNSEDYELFFRASRNSIYHNLQDILIEYNFNEKLIYKRLYGSILVRFKNIKKTNEVFKAMYFSIVQIAQSFRYFTKK